ncbi:hypothetical protein C1645_761090 [Glomus cerebriforme]|uniref:Uncharacterized protein n=1 Tax=Glomus cerebriforme TaxID=658196 RepID=A0A397T9J2_9GLOM|nr:hypothetical protein C1645_761090 [Glomus cerebriforme]
MEDGKEKLCFPSLQKSFSFRMSLQRYCRSDGVEKLHFLYGDCLSIPVVWLCKTSPTIQDHQEFLHKRVAWSVACYAE